MRKLLSMWLVDAHSQINTTVYLWPLHAAADAFGDQPMVGLPQPRLSVVLGAISDALVSP